MAVRDARFELVPVIDAVGALAAALSVPTFRLAPLI